MPVPRYAVSDVRVSMAIEAESPEKLSTKYTLTTRKRNLSFAIEGGKATLRVARAPEGSSGGAGEQGAVLAEASEAFDVPAAGAPFDVEFWHVDQRLSMWVNDRKVVELDYAFDSLEDRLLSSFNGRVVEGAGLRRGTGRQERHAGLRDERVEQRWRRVCHDGDRSCDGRHHVPCVWFRTQPDKCVGVYPDASR